MKVVPFLRFWFLFVIAALGAINGLWAMDNSVFQPTGKRYDVLNWNRTNVGKTVIQIYESSLGSFDPISKYNLANILVLGTPNDVKKVLTTHKEIWPLNTPSVITSPGVRSEELSYSYPLEYAIQLGAPAKNIEALLELGSPTSFPGYDPFKYILFKVMSLWVSFTEGEQGKRTANSRLDLYMKYIDTLLQYNVNPQTSSQGDIEELLEAGCRQKSSAHKCVTHLITYYENEYRRLDAENPREQGEKAYYIMPEKIEFLKKLQTKFDNYQPSPSGSPKPSLPTPPQVTTAATGNPALPAAASGPNISWQETVSQWCNQPRPNFVKTGACIVALAAVAIGTKLLYNRLVAKKTEAPANIIITNKSGTTVKLLYLEINAKEATSVTLSPGNTWSLDMNTIKLNLIVTEEQEIRNPLPIMLSFYKASVDQQHKSLHITIYKNAGLRYLWTRIPYTYTATWQ